VITVVASAATRRRKAAALLPSRRDVRAVPPSAQDKRVILISIHCPAVLPPSAASIEGLEGGLRLSRVLAGSRNMLLPTSSPLGVRCHHPGDHPYPTSSVMGNNPPLTTSTTTHFTPLIATTNRYKRRRRHSRPASDGHNRCRCVEFA